MAHKKSEVQLHSENYGPAHPAVNVKVYSYPDVESHFGCSVKCAERAGEFAWESAQEQFWNEDAPEIAKNIFGDHVEIYSQGRSAGWLVVHNLEPVESWSAITLSQWWEFERMIQETVAFLTSDEYVFDAIESNRWTEEGAERFNFIEIKDGENVCLSDLKKNAIEQGFGPVIRN